MATPKCTYCLSSTTYYDKRIESMGEGTVRIDRFYECTDQCRTSTLIGDCGVAPIRIQ